MTSKSTKETTALNLDKIFENTEYYPYWLDTVRDDSILSEIVLGVPKLSGLHKTDIVIVGGGLFGMSTAYASAKKGAKVIIIDENPLEGASINCLGAIVPGSPGDHPSHFWVHNISDEFAETAHRASQKGIENLVNFIRSKNLDVDLHMKGAVVSVVEDYQKNAWMSGIGHRIVFGDRIEYSGANKNFVNSPAYHSGAVIRSNAGTLNPAKLLFNLYRKVLEKSGSIFEGKAVRVSNDLQNNILVDVEAGEKKGRIQAKQLVIATNAYTDYRNPALSYLNKKIIPVESYVIKTEPFSNAQLEESGLKQGKHYTDSNPNFNCFRLAPDNGLIFQAGASYAGRKITDSERMNSFEEKYRELQKVFGHIDKFDELRITHAWSGVDAITPKFTPFFYQTKSTGFYYASGSSFHGIPFAFEAGKSVAKIILSGKDIRGLIPDDMDLGNYSCFLAEPQNVRSPEQWYNLWVHETKEASSSKEAYDRYERLSRHVKI